MKGKCQLCEAKSQDEFCPSCVCYLQRKANKALVPVRKMPFCASDQYSDRVFRRTSNFLTLQTCKYDEG